MEQVQHLPADLEGSPGADDDSAGRTARGADVCVHGRGPVMASDVCWLDGDHGPDPTGPQVYWRNLFTIALRGSTATPISSGRGAVAERRLTRNSVTSCSTAAAIGVADP